MRSTLIAAAALLAAGSALADDYVTHSFSSAAARGSIRRVVIDVPAGDVKLRNGAGDRVHECGWKPGRKRVEWREKLLHRLRHVQTTGLQTRQLGIGLLPTHQGM